MSHGRMVGKGSRFVLVDGSFAIDALLRDPPQVVELVLAAYIAYRHGAATNARNSILRPAFLTGSRFIALPAAIATDGSLIGVKWIASFPSNPGRGLPRASAIIILNDPESGSPIACMDGSKISAARTAASAVLAAKLIHPQFKSVARLGIVGTGPIARSTVGFLLGTDWTIGAARAFDRDAARSQAFAKDLRARGVETEAATDLASTVAESDLVIFATSALAPHVNDAALFDHAPTVLHLSLRDLAPAILLDAWNLVDDVDAALTAETSLHLAEQRVGHRRFVSATLAELALGDKKPPVAARLRVFSPFGMGILDLALAGAIYSEAIAQGRTTDVTDFLMDGSFNGLDFGGQHSRS